MEAYNYMGTLEFRIQVKFRKWRKWSFWIYIFGGIFLNLLGENQVLEGKYSKKRNKSVKLVFGSPEYICTVHCTLPAEMFGGSDFWLEIRVIIKISTHPCYPLNVDWFSLEWRKNSKKLRFSTPPILNIFSRKFQGLAFLITTITLLHAITYYINYKVLVNWGY